MDGSYNSLFKYGTTLVILTHASGFRSHEPQHTLSEKASPRFSYSDHTNARLFFKRDQAARHEFKIGHPGRDHIGYTVGESFNTSTKYFSVLTKF